MNFRRTHVFQPFRAPARPGAIPVFNPCHFWPHFLVQQRRATRANADKTRVGGVIAHDHFIKARGRRLSLSGACGYGPLARVPGACTRGGQRGGSDPPFTCLVLALDPLLLFITSGVLGPPSPRGGRSRLNDPCRKARIPEARASMKWSHVYLFLLGLAASIARYLLDPFPDGSQNPVIALMALNAPALLWLTHAWYAVMPGVVFRHRRRAHRR